MSYSGEGTGTLLGDSTTSSFASNYTDFLILNVPFLLTGDLILPLVLNVPVVFLKTVFSVPEYFLKTVRLFYIIPSWTFILLFASFRLVLLVYF